MKDPRYFWLIHAQQAKSIVILFGKKRSLEDPKSCSEASAWLKSTNHRMVHNSWDLCFYGIDSDYLISILIKSAISCSADMCKTQRGSILAENLSINKSSLLTFSSLKIVLVRNKEYSGSSHFWTSAFLTWMWILSNLLFEERITGWKRDWYSSFLSLHFVLTN